METILDKNELAIEVIKLKKAALTIRGVNHKLRQKILHVIHENKRIAVTNIYVALRIEQSVASQHLAILRRSGFVKTERNGKSIFYSVNYERLKELQELFVALG